MTAVEVDDNTVLKRGRDALAAPLNDRLLMLSVSRGSYFEFSPVLRRIWELLEQPRSLADLIAVLTAEYEVDPETCRADVVPVVQALIAADMISIA